MQGKTVPSANDDRPSGPRQIWAVGDVHGCSDLLAKLLSYLKSVQREGALPIVFLGDYVDRGPDTRGVLDQLIAFRDEPGVAARFIRGNHDDMLLTFLRDIRVGPNWHRYGGDTTLASYGVRAPALVTDVEAWAQTQADLAAALPPAHLTFLEATVPSLVWKDYFLCHAGARPGRPLNKQAPEDLMWIREVFLRDAKPFERIVVHGHTPAPAPYADDRRIGVDTGAYATGTLTAVLLDGKDPLFVQAQRDPAAPSSVRIFVSSSDVERELG